MPVPTFVLSQRASAALAAAARRPHPDPVLVLTASGSAPSVLRLVDRRVLHHPSLGPRTLERVAGLGGVDLFVDVPALRLCPHDVLVVDLLDDVDGRPTFVTRAESESEWFERMTTGSPPVRPVRVGT